MSKADFKPPGEEQSRKRLRQSVSHEVRRKWQLSTELIGDRKWMHFIEDTFHHVKTVLTSNLFPYIAVH